MQEEHLFRNMSEKNLVQQLFQQTTQIRQKYEQTIWSSGEWWNVFYAVGKRLYKDELFHSHFLSVLLKYQDKKTGQNIFLQKFLKLLNAENKILWNFSPFYTGTVVIHTEKSIGPITPDYEDGGRVDILLSKGNQQVVIETKIYAKDQPNQLYRYHKRYPNAAIVYLTLNGTEPSLESRGRLMSENYFCLSYRSDILKWLNDCLAYTENLPECCFLHSSIAQYINVIRNLTGQGRYLQMNQEIIKTICADKENLLSAWNIWQNFVAASNEILRTNFLTPLTDCLREKFEKNISLKELATKEGQVVGFDVLVPSWQNIVLRFSNELLNNQQGNSIYGLCFRSESAIKTFPEIANFIKANIAQPIQTEWWPLIRLINPDYQFWDFNTVVSLLDDNHPILNYYQEKIADLFELTNKMQAVGVTL